MSFFDAPALTDVPLATGRPTDFFDRFGASFKQETIRTDAWMRRRRTQTDILSDVSQRAFGVPDRWKLRGEHQFLSEVAALAEENPEDFRDLPKTIEDVNVLVNQQLQREYEEAGEILARAPEDAFAAETLGILARATTDEVGVAAVFAGFGLGTTLRAGALGNIAIESALGGASEALLIPKMRQTAEELGLEDPDALTQIILGFAGGAAGGAVIESIAGGVVAAQRVRGAMDRMMQARQEMSANKGIPQAEHQLAERQASDAVSRDELDDLPDVEAPESAFVPARGRDGLDSRGSDFDAIFDSLITQESNGNPAALGPVIRSGSNKGDQAIGLTQVMPNTAINPGLGVPDVFQVARDMGVSVGPASKAEAVRLLRNPQVNRAFGETYFRGLLDRYDGDTEAALIAYNAGPGNADKWVKSGRDYSVLPQRAQTEPYARNILARVQSGEDIITGFDARPRRYKASEIDEMPDRYQFKAETRDLGEFDEEASGLLVLHERLDGRTAVADGHSRLRSARAAGDDTPINAIVLREADGWTENDVLERMAALDYLGRTAGEEGRPAAVLSAQDANPALFRQIDELNDAIQALPDRNDPVQAERAAELEGERERLVARAEREVEKFTPRQEGPDGTPAPEAEPAGARPTAAAISRNVREPVQPGAGRRRPDAGVRRSAPIQDGPAPEVRQFAEPNGDGNAVAAGEGLRELQDLIDGEGAIEIQAGLTDRALIQDVLADEEFLSALELCPTGRA